MKKSELASERWARIVQRHKASGLSIAEFCRQHGLSPPSFFAWRRRLRSALGRTPAFVELKVAASEEGAGTLADESALELLLPGGRRVLVHRGFDRDLLRELLRALESPA